MKSRVRSGVDESEGGAQLADLEGAEVVGSTTSEDHVKLHLLFSHILISDPLHLDFCHICIEV